MELNKIAAAILLAGLIGMVTSKATDILYHAGGADSHSSEAVARGYAIEVPDDLSSVGTVQAKDEGVPSIIAALANADVAAGEAYFKKKCALCHTVEQGGDNKTGPNLWGVVGRDRASHEGFKYSSAMAAAEGSWDFDTLNTFIYKPKKAVPGTIMAFAGEKKEAKRADLIAYLRSMHSNPPAIPAAPEETATAE